MRKSPIPLVSPQPYSCDTLDIHVLQGARERVGGRVSGGMARWRYIERGGVEREREGLRFFERSREKVYVMIAIESLKYMHCSP